LKKRIFVCFTTITLLSFLVVGLISSVNAYTDLSKYIIRTDSILGESKAEALIRDFKKDTNWNVSLESTGDYLKYYEIVSGGYPSDTNLDLIIRNFKKSTGINGTYEPLGPSQNFYKVISGGYSGESNVRSILSNFENKTGIEGTYVPIGSSQNYYKIISGGYSDEEVKTVLSRFEDSTGIHGKYVPLDDSKDYFQIISGGYSGESNVKEILRNFENTTGINGTYESIGNSKKYYRLISGGYSGETNVRNILSQFESSTGIKATYEPIGKAKSYYQLVSGGYVGEQKVKKVLSQFESSTGIKGFYEKIGENLFQIKSSPLLGSDLVNKGREFFSNNGWSVTYNPTGEKVYDRFQIISEPVLGMEKVDKGREFFSSNGWSVTYEATGEESIQRFQIKSEPVLGMEKVNQGRAFFSSKGWSVTYQATGEKGHSRFQIESEPILGMEKVDQGRAFFSSKGWSVTYQATGEKENTLYQIESEPVMGMEEVNNGRNFFSSNGWSVTYIPTGEVGYERYEIKSEPVLGMESVDKGRDFFSSNGWSVTYQELGKENYYKVVTGQFTGIDKAKDVTDDILRLYGLNSSIIKTQNGPQLMYTDYNLTLNSMINKQMDGSPQTDKYRNEPRYVYADYVDMNNQVITDNRVNVRSSPTTSTSSNIVQQLNKGDGVLVIGKTGNWVEVRITWQNAKASDVDYYLDPSNFSMDDKSYFQFLKLSESANLSANEVNEKILKGKGILAGKGQAFIDAAKKHNINELYLISHALLETGNGSSTLATGVKVNGKTVYNMYGYGAYDSCPLECGSQTAYDQGWFTPEAAIIGGAKLISSGYIYNDTFQQDTLYKMRWNPVATWHQYATDIGWAYKQVNSIYNLYQLLDNYTIYYDVPKYY
jgi:mannosyl-glycoprotein endo-beta-N-acetylglucosaminidase